MSSSHDTLAPRRVHPTPLLVAGLVLVGIVLRVAAARDDLWMEEIRSLTGLRQLNGAWELLTRVHSDNRHLLNSLWLWVLGDAASFGAYRALAVVTGSGAVALLPVLARRDGPIAMLVVAALGACSFLLVLVSSEARGWAPLVLCALAAFAFLDARQRTRRPSRLVGFWIAAGAGFVSHPSFVIVWVALVLWSLERAWHERVSRPGRALFDVVAAHAVPLLLLVALWKVDLQYLSTGYWPLAEVGDLAGRTAALALGLPDRPSLWPLALAAAAAILGLGIARHGAGHAPDWFFHVAVLVLAPVLVLALWRPAQADFRFLLVSVPFLYLLLARVVAAAWDRRWSRAAALAVLAAVLGANLVRVAALVAVGRGQYCAAVAWMGEQTEGGTLRITSDDGFGDRMVLEFYERCLGPERHVGFLPSTPNPDWMILHSADPDEIPPAERVTRTQGRYQLARTFRHAGVSGWTWHVYRRVFP